MLFPCFFVLLALGRVSHRHQLHVWNDRDILNLTRWEYQRLNCVSLQTQIFLINLNQIKWFICHYLLFLSLIFNSILHFYWHPPSHVSRSPASLQEITLCLMFLRATHFIQSIILYTCSVLKPKINYTIWQLELFALITPHFSDMNVKGSNAWMEYEL